MEFEVMTVVGFSVERLVDEAKEGVKNCIDNIYYDEYEMLNTKQRKDLWREIAKKFSEMAEDEIYDD